MNNDSSFWLRTGFWVPSTALACACLFAIPALFPRFYPLQWIAFVPFLLGLQQCRSTWQAYGLGVLTGILAYGLLTYSIAEFVVLFKGYNTAHSVGLASLHWLYCAQAFGLIAVLTHYARRGGAVLWAFPTVLALVLALYPTIFPWQIGNSQSEFLVALQAVEITGVSGLDFVIGVVNVLVAQALISRPLFFRRGAPVAYVLVGVWFVYGLFSLAWWDRAVPSWEALKVGIVQPDEPPTIGTPGPRPGFSLGYPVEMDLTEQLVGAGADLVIWPELRNKQYYTKPFVQAAFQRQVADLERPLLFQSFEPVGRGDRVRNFNTATLIDGNGNQNGQYRKVKRIAIAEYLPLFDDSETVKWWVRQYLGEFFGDFSAGRDLVRFDLGETSIKPFICYEVLFPGFVAASVRSAGGDILTVQSNNSWFGDTRVPYQHMGVSVLRSVENRRPLVHVMNNGLGGVVLPSGRILLRTAHREIAGYLLDVPYRRNADTTFYSRYPYGLITLLGLGLVLMLVRARRAA
ncbi:apolipoprotein N-acyltransferase [Gilvimarinus sp. F26214L]|uniref:apolipoprotein N-acyltransferase n=1 Tax=Gilvimarinus sp. DZF01 TaxID=3461371 RepID=UPI004045346F